MLSLLTPLRQRESCSQKEDTCANDHHDLLLEGAKSGVVNLIVVSTIWLKNGNSWEFVHEKWAFQVAFYSIFKENTHVFITFSG